MYSSIQHRCLSLDFQFHAMVSNACFPLGSPYPSFSIVIEQMIKHPLRCYMSISNKVYSFRSNKPILKSRTSTWWGGFNSQVRECLLGLCHQWWRFTPKNHIGWHARWKGSAGTPKIIGERGLEAGWNSLAILKTKRGGFVRLVSMRWQQRKRRFKSDVRPCLLGRRPETKSPMTGRHSRSWDKQRWAGRAWRRWHLTPTGVEPSVIDDDHE